MQLDGIEETDPDFLQAALHHLGVTLHVDSQRGQHVGCAALGTNRAVAVLGHGNTRPRHHKRGGGRDIERVAAIATGAHGIHHRQSVGIDKEGVLPHRLHGPGDLVDALALHP